MFSPGNGGNWSAKSVTGAGKGLYRASSWGDVVLVSPGRNMQFNALADLDAQDLRRRLAGENCEKGGQKWGRWLYPELISSKICALLGSS